MHAWRWPAALVIALAAHMAILLQLPAAERGTARAQGSGGVTIALAPAGGRSGNAANDEAKAPESQTESESEPTPEPEPEPDPDPDPEPEPGPEPDERVIDKTDSSAESQPTPERKEPEQEAPKPPQPEQETPERESRDETPPRDSAEQASTAGTNARAGSGGGQEAGTSDGRAGGGNPGARRDYLAKLQAHLQRAKEYPRRARQRRIEGTVKVHFTVHADGRISDARIVERSGTRLLDRAALEMLRRADPAPTFPSDLEREQMSLTVPVAFRLR